MAQYFTDFSEYVTGQQPSDWTRRYAANFIWLIEEDASAAGGKLIRGFTESSNSRNGLSWDAVDSDENRQDAEIYMRVRFVGDLSESEILAMIRGQGGAGNETLYRHGPRPTNNVAQGGSTSLTKYNDGGFATIAQVTRDYISDIFFDVRVAVSGSSHKIKVWRSTEQEPSLWDVESSDTSITGVGYVGIFRFRTAAIDVDVFGVGTNGDPAPTEPVGGGGQFISELAPRTETSQAQQFALSAGSIQAATPASSTAHTVNLFTVAGNSQSALPVTDNSQAQLQQLIGGFSVALLPASDTSITQELGFIGGVRDDLIVALVPAADASALQDLQVRLGQLQQATPESDTSTLMTLNLVAGTSVPFSAVLSPDVDSAALQAQGFAAGVSAESEPATDTQGLVTLDDRAGQVISLDPAIESSITQTLGLFTGVVIGKFTRSSVMELSPQYSVSELSTAYDIIEQTPVYSVKEI